MRDRIFKYVFSVSLTVCIGYWGLCLGGKLIMSVDINIFLNLYVHLLIGVQMIFELLFTERKYLPNLFLYDYLINFIIITIYSFLLLYIAKTYELYIYPFLKLDVNQIIGIYIVLFLISFNSYQLYHLILEKKENNIKIKYNEKTLIARDVL